MKSLGLKTKTTTKYLLANHNGIEIYLFTPKKDAKEQRYYLDYNYNGQKKYYGNGIIKKKATDFFNNLSSQDKLKRSEIESQLTELFQQDIELIVHELHVVPEAVVVSMRSSVKEAIEQFYAYKTLQNLEGTIERRALTNYGQYHRKLLFYFQLQKHSRHTLNDLTSDFWVKYRIDLINGAYNLNTKKLGNASINQHFQYNLQLFCKAKKDSISDGYFHILTFFDEAKNAIFEEYPVTAGYMDEKNLKHIKAVYTYNTNNGYSKLVVYKENSFISKPIEYTID